MAFNAYAPPAAFGGQPAPPVSEPFRPPSEPPSSTYVLATPFTKVGSPTQALLPEDTSTWPPCPICATIEGTLDRLICDGCETEYVCVYISNAETLERGEHIVVHTVSLICLDQGVWVRRRH